MDVSDVERIMETVEEGWNVLAVAVPTRALRVIGDTVNLKYRVEQLDPTNWTWRTVSGHAGDEPWESFGHAIDDMIRKQARLKEKIKLKMHESNMALLAAQNPTGTLQ